jgi:hypothetical protein
MIAIALLMLGSVACDSPFDPGTIVSPSTPGGTNPTPASIVLATSAPSLVIGQSTTVSATVKGADGSTLSGVQITWSSSAPAVANVSAAGVVSALQEGSATITGASGSIRGQTTISVVAAPATGGFSPSPVALPQTSLDTKMPAAPDVGGTIISVAAGGDLQAAINRANPGDVIELARGATFTGNFTLPNKTGNSWVIIRPSSSGAAIPAEGQRMTPAIAASALLPRIQSPNGNPAIQTLAGAHHFRLVGLDIGVDASVSSINTIIGLGVSDASQSTLASIPHDIVLDRLFVHGTTSAAVRRCVAFNSASSAIIDSYVSECHDAGFVAQAVTGWNGPGPFKIVNNYLEASGEIVAFGGADPTITNLIPSDIEIRKNHITRPLSWKGRWLIKNLMEIKSANRVLLEENVLENNWLGGHDGTAILLKSVNQSGNAPWSNTSDITIRNNLMRNVGAAFNLAANPESYPCVPMSRVAITGNIILNINTTDFNGTGRAFQLLGNLSDITIAHNTVTSPSQIATLGLAPTGARMTRIVFDNNLSGGAQDSGILGQDASPGSAAWNMFVQSGSIQGNAIASVASDSPPYPSGNYLLASQAAVGFADLASGDVSLSLASPVKGKATDGTDPGADVQGVLAGVRGVVIP